MGLQLGKRSPLTDTEDARQFFIITTFHALTKYRYMYHSIFFMHPAGGQGNEAQWSRCS
jgi:hypothetical protein